MPWLLPQACRCCDRRDSFFNVQRAHVPRAGPDDADLEQARALKRPRLVWTAKLHKRFVEAVEQLGLKNAVPKTIMQARALLPPYVAPPRLSCSGVHTGLDHSSALYTPGS